MSPPLEGASRVNWVEHTKIPTNAAGRVSPTPFREQGYLAGKFRQEPETCDHIVYQRVNPDQTGVRFILEPVEGSAGKICVHQFEGSFQSGAAFSERVGYKLDGSPVIFPKWAPGTVKEGHYTMPATEAMEDAIKTDDNLV